LTSPRHARVRFDAPDLVAIEVERTKYKNAGLAVHTILSYERDWRVFTAWCAAASRAALPATPETVELYVCDLLRQGRKVSTLERHAAGIQYRHRLAGHESPCGPDLRTLLCGARRSLGQEPDQKEAIGIEDLRRMVEAIDVDKPIGTRDRALLLFGFASALRRSNLAALELGDLTFQPRGIQVWIGHEKQDREGYGRKIAIPYGEHEITCPVQAVRRWLRYRGEDPGPLFQGVLNGRVTGKAILPNRIGQLVQEAVARIGLDPKRYAAHSLRAGFATEALTGGASEIMVAQQTGHRSLETLRTYLRSRDPFRGHAGSKIGL
jgi:site-specific recombinase XerD